MYSPERALTHFGCDVVSIHSAATNKNSVISTSLSRHGALHRWTTRLLRTILPRRRRRRFILYPSWHFGGSSGIMAICLPYRVCWWFWPVLSCPLARGRVLRVRSWTQVFIAPPSDGEFNTFALVRENILRKWRCDDRRGWRWKRWWRWGKRRW